MDRGLWCWMSGATLAGTQSMLRHWVAGELQTAMHPMLAGLPLRCECQSLKSVATFSEPLVCASAVTVMRWLSQTAD